MNNPGKSVRMFLVDGTTGGLVTAEIMNWTGHVIAAPRSDLPHLLQRTEAARTGVYLLLGDGPNGEACAYIGEGDVVASRLRAHAKESHKGGKDFWDRVVVLTSKDTHLTKAHARYLESRLISLAGEAKRIRLENGTAPDPLQLPEADISDMEFYIEQARIVLPVLGIDIFRAARVPGATTPESSPVFQIVSQHGVDARAQEVDGEFTVLQGSVARREWQGSSHTYGRLRQRLEDDGTIAANSGGMMVFTKDQPFASVSAAGAAVLGRPNNGRTEWKVVATGQTYHDWQASLLPPADE